MQQQGLKAIQPRSFVPRTTDSTHGLSISPNLLLNQPLPIAPDSCWVGDITYIPLVNGQWAYLAGWMDLFSRVINNLIKQSMSRADDPYDNAFMESYFSRFKAELLEDGIFENLEDAQTETFEFIEMYYNPKRRHSSLGYLSPLAFERKYYLTLSNHPQN